MKSIGISALMLSLSLPAASWAEDNVNEVYRYRSDVMESSASHLRALKEYAAGRLPIQSHVATHIDALLGLNALYPEIFPVGEQHPESEALPVIWNDSRGFLQANQHNRRKILALKKVDIDDLQSFKRAVNEVRMSCGDCHSYYRDR